MNLSIALFFLIDIGLCIAYVTNQLLGQPFFWKVTLLLDLNSESSLCAWYSSIKYFCVFLVSLFFSYQKNLHGNSSRLLFTLPILFLLLSIDETVQIHEWLGAKSDLLFPSGSREGSYFHVTGIWPFVVGLPFLAFFLILTHQLKRYFSDNPSSLIKLIVGMMIMLTGALGFEVVRNFVHWRYEYITVAFEEGLEMAGVTVMLWAVYDMAEKYISPAKKIGAG